MSAAGALPCGCCTAICGCAKASAPFVEACGFATSTTAASFDLESLPVKWTRTRVESHHARPVPPEHQGYGVRSPGTPLNYDATLDATYEVELVDGVGTVDAGPLVSGCSPVLYGVRRYGPTKVVGSSETIADGPVTFDTITGTGLPQLVPNYKYSYKIKQTFEQPEPGDTHAPMPDGVFSLVYEDADFAKLIVTMVSWNRRGGVYLELKAAANGMSAPTQTSPESDSRPMSVPGTRPLYSVAGAGASGVATCAFPSTHTFTPTDVLPATESYHSQTTDPPADPYPNTSGYIGTDGGVTDDETYAYSYRQVSPNARQTVFVGSATVKVAAATPHTNPGCRSCHRAYRVKLTVPSLTPGGTARTVVDAVFPQDCFTPSAAASQPAAARTYPYYCRWGGLGSLERLGPLLWSCRGILLKGSGDCPESITESDFFVENISGPNGHVTGQRYMRYTIEITPAAVPAGYQCFCDLCDDCSGVNATLTALLCDNSIAVPMTRTSAAPCNFTGEADGGITGAIAPIVGAIDGARYYELTIAKAGDGGWTIRGRKPCGGGPAGAYDVTTLAGDNAMPPCLPTQILVG